MCIIHSALYNIMHYGEPSFVISPPFVVESVNHYLLFTLKYNLQVLVKPFQLMLLDVNTYIYAWWRSVMSAMSNAHEEVNMFKHRSVHFETIMFGSFTRALMKVLCVIVAWRHVVDWDCDVIRDVIRDCCECNRLGMRFTRKIYLDSRFMLCFS